MKKIVGWLMVIVLTAAVAVGGTMAYLMDSDDDVNVMTVGNVKIEQLEYERVDVETSNDIVKLLHEIKESGTTVVMTTHNLSFLENFPGRVFSCENGKLIVNQ